MSSPFNPRPQAKEMRITNTVWGTPITRSMSQVMKPSTAREPVAAAMPMSTAAMALSNGEAGGQALQGPQKESRPRWSVPKG